MKPKFSHEEATRYFYNTYHGPSWNVKTFNTNLKRIAQEWEIIEVTKQSSTPSPFDQIPYIILQPSFDINNSKGLEDSSYEVDW